MMKNVGVMKRRYEKTLSCENKKGDDELELSVE